MKIAPRRPRIVKPLTKIRKIKLLGVPRGCIGGILEALGGVLRALESVLEALDVVLEAMLGQDSPKQAHESKP